MHFTICILLYKLSCEFYKLNICNKHLYTNYVFMIRDLVASSIYAQESGTASKMYDTGH